MRDAVHSFRVLIFFIRHSRQVYFFECKCFKDDKKRKSFGCAGSDSRFFSVVLILKIFILEIYKESFKFYLTNLYFRQNPIFNEISFGNDAIKVILSVCPFLSYLFTGRS